jgi:hypothetical protein
MPNYLVEVYRLRLRGDELARAGRRARTAAEVLTRQGTPIRFRGSIAVPVDEMCLYVYEAASPAAVDAATRSAAIRAARVVEAVLFDWDERKRPYLQAASSESE